MDTISEVRRRGAIFSPCRQYRYALWREWEPAANAPHSPGFVMFVGLNPSTADETVNDRTVSRCIDFAKRWGYRHLAMMNIFAFRATDPKVMKRTADPIGPENDENLALFGTYANLAIAAWGTGGAHLDRESAVMNILNRVRPLSSPLHCLAMTRAGHPKHPLYLRGDTVPTIYFPDR